VSVLLVLLFAANAKFAMVGFVAGEGISDASFRAISDTLAGELRQQSAGQLITSDEIKSLLSVEEQKQMVGCSSESCFAEIGGALGAERIVSGSIGKVGKSWMLVIKAIHSKHVGEVKQVTRRIKDGSIDDVLDVIAPAVRELLGGAGPPPSAPPAPEAPKGQNFDPKIKAVPSSATLALTQVFGDGRGHFLAIEPKSGSSTNIFFGTAAGVYQQKIESSGRNGPRASFAFADPRYVDGWQRQIIVEADTASVQCGEDRKLEYKLLRAADAAPAYKAPVFAQLLKVFPVALGVDGNGVYYYVDSTGGQRPAHRLFIGKKGTPLLTAVDTAVRAVDGRATYLTASGKLVVKEKTMEWVANGSTIAIDAMNLYVNAPMVFTELGMYPKALQTPCDE
jgi:hypothetical protein